MNYTFCILSSWQFMVQKEVRTPPFKIMASQLSLIDATSSVTANNTNGHHDWQYLYVTTTFNKNNINLRSLFIIIFAIYTLSYLISIWNNFNLLCLGTNLKNDFLKVQYRQIFAKVNRPYYNCNLVTALESTLMAWIGTVMISRLVQPKLLF